MPSLRHVLAAHHPLLLLDAASTRTQVGWFPSPDLRAARWARSDEESGVALFKCVANLGGDVAAVRGWAFCEGPGSILGIRTSAMALRAWNALAQRPAFAYSSLALVAHALARPDVTVIADARRDLWHSCRGAGPCSRVRVDALQGELVMPAGFRHWSALPAGVQIVPYEVADLLSTVADTELFRPTEAPDAFLHEEPSYVTWIPHVHRAPQR